MNKAVSELQSILIRAIKAGGEDQPAFLDV
jgi:hypothetical protein